MNGSCAWWQRRRWHLVGIYMLLLALSLGVRLFRPDPPPLAAGAKAIVVQAVAGEQTTREQVRLAYRAYGASERPALLLLHGSPGSSSVFAQAVPYLAQHYYVLVPDLPGFGSSTHRIPDYSIRAHAHYVLALLDTLQIERVHVVGFSMGGGVALNLAELAPQRIASLVMLAAIGVQEFELLGEYHLNHSVHGVQLALLLLLREGVPHFGLLDDFPIDVPYGRNFFDTDQRPLRAILERYNGPMLIIQGMADPQVPPDAAMEHYRIVPQSELLMLPESHFMIFQKPEQTALQILAFVERVEVGQVRTRAEADPARVLQAELPLDMHTLPMYSGIAALVLLLLLVLATFISEDLACIGAGVLVAQGRLEYGAAVSACFLGIYLGDLLIFLLGRRYGQGALQRPPFKWFLNADDVERGGAWFTRKGIAVIIASRFLPGTRVATYFAAGMLSKNFWRFALYFFAAIALWVPLLVGLAAFLGAEVLSMLLMQNVLIELLLVIVAVYLVSKLLVSLVSWRGRRLLLGTWRSRVRWEFWPRWPMCSGWPANIAA
jgi:pimeloyl-ACP methyl ester carboxylesterase/membrane protein DedA with SNARE-associated domain